MENKLPLGYWFKESKSNLLRIGFQYGGHMGGECEIFLPKDKLDKFCSDSNWRRETVNKFSKIVFLSDLELNVKICEEEKNKNGIVPDNWE
mgnify:CR=1 FL=1|tara:strand:+ start:1907 stop:2179 length:273 start_codon:yes stop_codon:yes gene_type:complete